MTRRPKIRDASRRFFGAALILAIALSFGISAFRASLGKSAVKPSSQAIATRGGLRAKYSLTLRRAETSPAAERALFMDDQRRLKAWLNVSPVHRGVMISDEAMEPYAAILAGLHLSPARLDRLKQLIVERAECASDADRLGQENRCDAALTLILRRNAEAIVDREIEEIVGGENFQFVNDMLHLTPQLQEIAAFLGRALTERGDVLTASQTLALARVYQNVYVGNPTDPAVDRTAGFDLKTGLGSADRRLLADAADFLTASQLETLRAAITKSSDIVAADNP